MSAKTKSGQKPGQIEEARKSPSRRSLWPYVLTLLAGVFAGVTLRPATRAAEASLLSDWSQPPPWPVFIGVNVLAGAFKHVSEALLPPPVRMLDLSGGYQLTMLAYACEKLQIARFLSVEDRPKSAAEVAAFLRLDAQEAGRVERLLLALAAHDLAKLVPPGGGEHEQNKTLPRFSNSALSATLRPEHPNYIGAFVRHQVEDMYPVWQNLAASFSPETSDVALWDLAWGAKYPLSKGGVWNLFESLPEREEQFGRAMSAIDGLGAEAMVDDGPFGKFSRFVDVGGSRGHLLHRILSKHEAATGVLFDRLPVIENAKTAWQTEAAFNVTVSTAKSRISFESGSFFDFVPVAREKGDAFLMRYILHDWAPGEVKRILANVRRAMDGKEATLLIGECAMPNHDQTAVPPTIHSIDMQMMMVANVAQERSPAEWAELFKETGFKLVQIHPTRSLLHWVEAVPV